ncbi:MAG TPA: phosphoribosylglycinamide formyltransferase [Magnetospirillaceae bacterium]
MTARKKRIAVLASGRGSNLQSLLDACVAPDYPAAVSLVIVNVPGAKAIDRAQQAGVPVEVINHKDYAGREPFDAAIDAALRKADIELVCLAGFMRLLTPGFTRAWEGRLLNIHPSLLPAYPGLHTHRRALEAGDKFHGCTIHFVTPDLDAGPTILQQAVPVQDGDDEDKLAARVLEAEHVLYPAALKLVAEGRARMENGKTVIESLDS